MGGTRKTFSITAAVAGLALAGLLVLTTSAQEDAATGLQLSGDTISDKGELRLDGRVDVHAVDVAAGTIVLLGTFTGTLADQDSAVTELAEQSIHSPVLGLEPAGSCEALVVDTTGVIIDASPQLVTSSEASVRLSNSEEASELNAALCQLVRIFSEDGPGSIDELVFRINDQLRS